MGTDMIPQRLMGSILALPLPVLFFVSISYWRTYGRQEKSGSEKEQIGYNKLFLALVAAGYFSIWVFWLGGVALLLLERYYAAWNMVLCQILMAPSAQILGAAVVYFGSLFFAWAIAFAGKSLRPSTSGMHAGHGLIQNGPLGVVRHPYYVSYAVILAGLGLALSTLLPLFFAVLVIIGMVPTAEAEERQLTALFGEEYRQYQRRVGRFIPKLFHKRNGGEHP
jgi:protein-S-isoprenylcysteine O-methyltransferase Ste14